MRSWISAVLQLWGIWELPEGIPILAVLVYILHNDSSCYRKILGADHKMEGWEHSSVTEPEPVTGLEPATKP